MRPLSLLLPALALLAACQRPAPEPTPDPDAEAAVAAHAFGQSVPNGEALSPAQLIADADGLDGQTVLVEGTIREVCQQAGCWLAFGDDEGRTVRVEVPRDSSEQYVFTFPKDAAGQRVRVQGTLAVETESADERRHYAEDGGATPAEIDAITGPRRTLVLTALGAEFAGEAQPTSGVAPA